MKESLPKACPCVLGVNKPRLLLQDFYKLHEIASWLETLQQQVNVIWRYAISVNGERELGRFKAKEINEPIRKRF